MLMKKQTYDLLVLEGNDTHLTEKPPFTLNGGKTLNKLAIDSMSVVLYVPEAFAALRKSLSCVRETTSKSVG
jgi:hypothetical protein